MRAILIIIVVALVGWGGYTWYEGQQRAAAEMAAKATADAKAAADAEAKAAADKAAADKAAADKAAADKAAADKAAADAAAQAAADAAAKAVAGAAGVDPASLLSASTFDADKLTTFVQGSDKLSAVQKTTLSAALKAAKDNPALVGAAIQQIKSALGL